MTREGDGNFLVTPYYAEAGGTVLDWIMPNEDTKGRTEDDGLLIDMKGIRK